MIYGYSEQVVDEEYGLLQMREITFSMTPEQLRLVAKFLERIAHDIESGVPFLHRHIEEIIPSWRDVGHVGEIVAIVPNQVIEKT